MSLSVDDKLHFISTLIYSTWSSGQSSASGFFYHKLSKRNANREKESKTGYVAVEVEELWLVTNRHVIVNNDNEIANSITFYYRKTAKNGYEWIPITIHGDDLRQRCKFHQSDDVDVAVINILDILTDLATNENETFMALQTVSEGMFPGKGKAPMAVGDDVLIVGYPRGFYDEFSKFPIVKSGVVASRWGAPFGGNPYFLIDAKLFPGSSGSMVISRPTEMFFEKGILYHTPSKQKEFLFLGIYSGEPYRKTRPIETDNFIIISKEGYDIGVVWYYHLVPTIISKGKVL